MASTLVVTINPDGSGFRTDARKMAGSEKDILAELNLLAALVDKRSYAVVEKHEPGKHVHHHGDDKVHSHG